MLTAHYGVLLRHLRNAFGTWHVGSPEYMIVEHARVDVMVHLVADGYYVKAGKRTREAELKAP